MEERLELLPHRLIPQEEIVTYIYYIHTGSSHRRREIVTYIY